MGLCFIICFLYGMVDNLHFQIPHTASRHRFQFYINKYMYTMQHWNRCEFIRYIVPINLKWGFGFYLLRIWDFLFIDLGFGDP